MFIEQWMARDVPGAGELPLIRPEEQSLSPALDRRAECAAMQKPTEEQIRARAHELWEQAGKPQGREDELWLLAEKDLSERSREQPESKIVPG
jgi:hypothetical protein